MEDIIVGSKTVIGEARGQGFMGQVAVAWVIRNRAQHARWWGGPDWESVCLQPWQFSCWNENNPNLDLLKRLTVGDIFGGEIFRQCTRAVLSVYDAVIPDPTGHATHYVVTSCLKDPDLRPAWADELKFTRAIGDHSFFTTLE